MLERRARYGHQGVDGDGLDAELGQRDCHIDAVFPGFAHADDAAGADAEAFLLGHLYRADTVIVRMSRAYVREEAPACLYVMMIARDAGGMQLVQLLLADQSVRGAESDVQFLRHALIGVDGFLPVVTDEGTPRGDDGEAVGSCILVRLGVRDDLVLVHEAVFLDACMMAGSLRAVAAVLTAAARAAVHYGAEVDMAAAEMLLQAAGLALQLIQRSLQEIRHIIATLEAQAGYDLIREFM